MKSSWKKRERWEREDSPVVVCQCGGKRIEYRKRKCLHTLRDYRQLDWYDECFSLLCPFPFLNTPSLPFFPLRLKHEFPSNPCNFVGQSLVSIDNVPPSPFSIIPSSWHDSHSIFVFSSLSQVGAKSDKESLFFLSETASFCRQWELFSCEMKSETNEWVRERSILTLCVVYGVWCLLQRKNVFIFISNPTTKPILCLSSLRYEAIKRMTQFERCRTL